MTKAVLLPFTGDCFLLKKWLNCFDVWRDEIDKLYIMLNADVPPEVRQYCKELINKYCSDDECKIFLLNEDRLLDHGPALNELLDMCNEELILLIEEDGMIFKKGQVEKCFRMIELGKYDIIASPRGSCPEELWGKENRLWPDSPEQEPNFWPNFLFCKKSDLLRTDRHFSAKSWNKGDYIPQLDHTIEDDVVPSDTFVWASIQLRALGLKIKLLPQYHAMVEDLEFKDRIEGVFDRKAPWIHFGSSSTWRDILLNPVLPIRYGTPEEWEVRESYWLMCWEDAQKDLPEYIQAFSNQYKAGLDRLMTEYTLSESRVKYRADLYRRLLNES